MGSYQEPSAEPCAQHGVRYCSLCGGLHYGRAFKGGFICEECVELIRQSQV